MHQPECRTLKVPAAAAPDGVATVAALRDAGLSTTMITKRCRPGGPWQRLLPGVVMLDSGPPSRRQQLRAAVALAGPEAVITGVDALRAQGLDLPAPHAIRLLLPTQRRLMPKDFVVVERSTRMPEPRVLAGLPFAPAARAALDVARGTSDPVLLRKVLAMVALNGLATRDELQRELDAGNQRGSSAVRLALRDFDATTASMLHLEASRILHSTPLPPPRWNVTVYDRKGRAIGYADAWWDEVAVAWQIGQPNAAGPVPPHRHLALTAAGAQVVRTPASAVHEAVTDERKRQPIIRALSSAFLAAARRNRPPLEGRCLSLPNTA